MPNNPTNQNDVIKFPEFNPFKLSTYVPAYQYWCGPDWSAGQRIYGKLTREQKEAPVGQVFVNGEYKSSQLDTACKAHDIRYNDAIGASNEAYQILQADILLMQDIANFDWSLMTPTERTYTTLLATSFTLKLAAIDTTTSAFEALKNQAASLASTLFSNPEFRNEFQLSNPFVDGFGSSMSGGFDPNGNIFLNFSKTLTNGSSTAENKTLNATFLGQDVSSMFNTDFQSNADKFSLKPDFSLTTTNPSGNQTTSPVTLHHGNKLPQLANSGMIATDAVYVDANGNPVSLYNSLFVAKDSELGTFTLIKNNIYTPLKDGTLVAVNAVINVIDSATTSLISFINHQIEGIFEPIFKELFSTDDSTKDTNGDNAAQRLAGKILADLIQGKDITQIANDTTSQVLIQNLLSDASKKLAASIPTGPLGADTAAFVQGTIAGAVINFAIAVAADRRMDLSDRACSHSQEWQNGGQNALRFERIAGMSFAYPRDEYGTAAAKALTSAAANDNFSTMEKLKIKREVRL